MTLRISTANNATPSAATVLTVDGHGGLSARGKFIAGILTVLLLLGAGVALAMADSMPMFGGRANAVTTGGAPQSPERLGTGTTVAGASALPAATVQAEWDGPAVHLDWTGAEYARAETTFIGERKASPGDRVTRTLNVVNAGPGEGVAAVTLDVTELVPEGALNPELAKDVTLFWDIAGVTGEETFEALKAGDRVTVAEVAVQQGATVPVAFGFAMDAAVETSNASGAPSTELSFDVGVNLTGETSTPEISVTGGTGVLALICIALALLLIGFMLVVAKRRREEDDRLEVTSV